MLCFRQTGGCVRSGGLGGRVEGGEGLAEVTVDDVLDGEVVGPEHLVLA